MKSLSNTHDKLNKLFKNGIRVYPVIKKYKFAVCIEDDYNAIYKNKKTVGEYKHTTKTINKAIKQTINYLINKL